MWTRTRCFSSSTGERAASETGRSYGRDDAAKCDVARAGGGGGGTDVDVDVVDGSRRITTSLMRSNRDTSSSNSTICRAVSSTPPPCIARFRARARTRSAGPGRRDATTKIGAASPMTTTNDDDDDDGGSGGGEEALGNRWNALNTDPAVSFSSSSSSPAKDGQLTPVYFSRSRHARIYFHSNPTRWCRDPTRRFWKSSRDTRFSFAKQPFTIVDPTCDTCRKI